MKELINHLSEKGWKKKDIDKALKIIKEAKKKKHPQIKILDKLVYWFSLMIAIIGNLFISISLIPILVSLTGSKLFLVIITLGISFGLLFELLVRTIENLKIKHHLFLGIIIPIFATLNFILVSNNTKNIIGLENPHDPITVGSIYAIAFILPYMTYQIILKKS